MDLEERIKQYLDEIERVSREHGLALTPTYVSSGLNVEARELGEQNFQANIEKMKQAIVIVKGTDVAQVFFQTESGLELKEELNLKIYSDPNP